MTRTVSTSSNGSSRHQYDKVRVAVIGVGNCASSFVQGVHYYRDADPTQSVPGLMHVDLGGYHVRDIEFSAAFDIDVEKVGKDLSEAIFSGQNNTIKFDTDVPKLNVPVMRGMTHDGLGKYLSQRITKAPGETVDIVEVLKETRTDVVVSYLPVGSEQATKWYVEQILEAGCGFVNCIPVFIAREDYWNKRFKKAGLPIVGDDIKSQVGATIVHRQLARLFHDRGVKLLRTSQLNVGGNMDFFNMLERERLESKKISKTNAVTSIVGHELPPEDVHVGPSDYVPWLTDRKWAHIRLEGQAFGDVPLSAELKLEVWDSPNSAGIVTDAVRCCKLAMNSGLAGQLDGPSSYLMKSPMHQRPDDEARELTEKFIHRYARKPEAAAAAKRDTPGAKARTATGPARRAARPRLWASPGALALAGACCGAPTLAVISVRSMGLRRRCSGGCGWTLGPRCRPCWMCVLGGQFLSAASLADGVQREMTARAKRSRPRARHDPRTPDTRGRVDRAHESPEHGRPRPSARHRGRERGREVATADHLDTPLQSQPRRAVPQLERELAGHALHLDRRLAERRLDPQHPGLAV
jgi:myo-inositol-1-phosphate synthase